MTRELSQQVIPPTVDNTALAVVTYNPDTLFIARIQAAAAQFGTVVLVDNSESEQPGLAQLDPGRFRVTANMENLGLACALNMACTQALELGYDWVVTLDQDTDLHPDFLQGMLAAWRDSSPLTALLGCNYYNVSRSNYRVAPSDVARTLAQTTVITSGCLTYLPLWSVLGKFRDDYFIDAIDHEFSLRVRQAGFVVAINRQAAMSHEIGNELEYGSLVSRWAPYRHSVWRKYTGTRNAFRTVMDYAAREPAWCVKKVLGLLLELAAIIVLEPDKRIRLRAFFLGLQHAYQGKLGPVPAELQKL